MIFTDFIFFLFLIIAVLLYYIFPTKSRWIILLVTSLLFYASWGVELLPFVAITTFIVWIFACWIEERQKKIEENTAKKGTKNRRSVQVKVRKGNKYILWTATYVILAVLIYTKTQKN